MKLRRHRLRTAEMVVALRRQDYVEQGLSVRLNRATAALPDLVPPARALFERLFEDGAIYRSTTVVLTRLESDRELQYELFEDRVRMEQVRETGSVIDAVNGRYGKHTLFAGSGLYLQGRNKNSRDEIPWRKTALVAGESARRRLALPRLDIQV